MTRKEALQQFGQEVIDGNYGDSPEAFEQWLEDNDIQIEATKEIAE